MLRTAAALAFALVLAACGGGDDGPVIDHPLQVTVASSSYAFPNAGPEQDVKFMTGTFANRGPGALNLQVRATSTRELVAPASAGGSLYLFVSVEDVTAGQLVATDCHSTTASVAPNAKLAVAEDLQCSVSIPEGHTFAFTPIARVVANAPTASGFVLATTNYALTVQ